MKSIAITNIEDVEFYLNEKFNVREYYANKKVNIELTPFVYVAEDDNIKQKKLVLTWQFEISDSITNELLLKHIAEQSYFIEFDNNKDFRMLRNLIFDSFSWFHVTFARKGGYQLAEENFRREPKDFDSYAYRIIDE